MNPNQEKKDSKKYIVKDGELSPLNSSGSKDLSDLLGSKGPSDSKGSSDLKDSSNSSGSSDSVGTSGSSDSASSPGSFGSNALKFTGIGFQLLATIALFTFIGYKADHALHHNLPWMTAIFSLAGVCIGLYLVIRQSQS